MKNIFTFSFAVLLSTLSWSCTTFVIQDEENLVFGRNLDWVSDNGVVVVNKRNLQKTALVFSPEVGTRWTSKYGSVTFNQFGKEFPFGGINEKGLVVEVMVVPGKYPDVDERTALNELQWVQYQLDNASSIDEVINSDKQIRISGVSQNLHFLVCDKNGNVAVIEFTSRGILVYRGDDLPFPVLENDPYASSLAKRQKGKSSRFSTASKLVEQYSSEKNLSVVDYSFSILDKVALDGSWSIVYDIKNMKIHFKTTSNRKLRSIDVLSFDFDCKRSSLLYDLRSKDVSLINDKFNPFTFDLNKLKMEDAIRTNRINLPNEVLQQFYGYATKCPCAN